MNHIDKEKKKKSIPFLIFEIHVIL